MFHSKKTLCLLTAMFSAITLCPSCFRFPTCGHRHPLVTVLLAFSLGSGTFLININQKQAKKKSRYSPQRFSIYQDSIQFPLAAIYYHSGTAWHFFWGKNIAWSVQGGGHSWKQIVLLPALFGKSDKIGHITRLGPIQTSRKLKR